MEVEEPKEVLLIDEEGGERRFLLHDAFDVDEIQYYLVEAADDPEQVLLLKDRSGTLEAVMGEEFDQVIARLESESEEEE